MIFDLLLLSVVLFIWLKPAINSILKREFNFLHPNVIYPFLFCLTMGNSLLQKWSNWIKIDNKSNSLRLSSEFEINYNDNFFILPMLYFGLYGLAFHLGVKRVKIKKINISKIYELPFFRKNISYLFLCIVVLIVLLPLVLFGDKAGFFWASALVYSIGFLFIIGIDSFKLSSLFIFIPSFLISLLRGSKGDAIFFFLPFILYRLGKLKIGKIKVKKRTIALFSLVLIGVFPLMKSSFGSKGIDLTVASIGGELMKREYSFDVFSKIVNSDIEYEKGGLIYNEITESIPAFIIGDKVNNSRYIFEKYLPEDYSYTPEAGFYIGFPTIFFIDYGLIFSVIAFYFLGYFLSLFYKKIILRIIKDNEKWRLLCYISVLVFSEFVINGVLSYAFVHFFLTIIVLYFTKFLSRLE